MPGHPIPNPQPDDPAWLHITPPGGCESLCNHCTTTMSKIKVAVASNSLGKSAAGHSILRKLDAARSHGFEGVEVAFECLEAHSTSFSGSRSDALKAAAHDIATKANRLSLSLIALNPFGAYDGLTSPTEVEDRLKEATLWCELCQIMSIPIFQVWSLSFWGAMSLNLADHLMLVSNR